MHLKQTIGSLFWFRRKIEIQAWLTPGFCSCVPGRWACTEESRTLAEGRGFMVMPRGSALCCGHRRGHGNWWLPGDSRDSFVPLAPTRQTRKPWHLLGALGPAVVPPVPPGGRSFSAASWCRADKRHFQQNAPK